GEDDGGRSHGNIIPAPGFAQQGVEGYVPKGHISGPFRGTEGDPPGLFVRDQGTYGFARRASVAEQQHVCVARGGDEDEITVGGGYGLARRYVPGFINQYHRNRSCQRDRQWTRGSPYSLGNAYGWRSGQRGIRVTYQVALHHDSFRNNGGRRDDRGCDRSDDRGSARGGGGRGDRSGAGLRVSRRDRSGAGRGVSRRDRGGAGRGVGSDGGNRIGDCSGAGRRVGRGNRSGAGLGVSRGDQNVAGRGVSRGDRSRGGGRGNRSGWGFRIDHGGDGSRAGA